MSLAIVATFLSKESFAANTACDFAALVQAASQSGTYKFTCDVVITFTNEIAINEAIEFDATGHNVLFDGQGIFRFFDIAPGGSLTLRNIILQSGHHEGIAAHVDDSLRGVSQATNGEGAAIRNRGRLEAINCTFMGNVAEGGAAAHNGLTLSASVGLGTGGAIYSAGEMMIESCVFASNLSTGGDAPINNFPATTPGADGLGGAIYLAAGHATIRNSTLTNNIAQASRSNTGGANGQGGGVFLAGGTAQLVGSTLSSNLEYRIGRVRPIQCGEICN